MMIHNIFYILLFCILLTMSCTPCFLQDSEISGNDATEGLLVVLPNFKSWGAGYESLWDYEHKSVIIGKCIPSFTKSSCLGIIRLILNKIQLFKYLKIYLVEMYGLLDTLPRLLHVSLVNFGVFECL